MEDLKKKARMNALQELIDLMEEKTVEGLKSKSPKFTKVETNDHEMAKDVVKGAMTESEDGEDKFLPEDESEEVLEEADEFEEDEDMARLMEMYRKLK